MRELLRILNGFHKGMLHIGGGQYTIIYSVETCLRTSSQLRRKILYRNQSFINSLLTSYLNELTFVIRD